MRSLWHDIGRDTQWVLISYTIWGIGEGLWMFIQPLYVKSLGATPDQAGIVLGMWGLGRLLVILPAGILADRLGARKMMLPGWFLGFAGVLLIAIAPDWRWAAPGFLVYGASALAIPISNLYMVQAKQHDPTCRPDLPIQTSLTLMWAAYSLGILITPAIGGWIGDQVGLRAVFLISVGWFLLSTLAIFKTSIYPAAELPERGTDYGALLRQKPVMLAFGLTTLGFTVVMIGQPLSSQYLEEVYHFSRTTIGTFGSINAFGTMIFSLVLGRLAVWRGFLSSLLIVLGSFALLLLTGSPGVVVIAVFMLGAYYTMRPLASGVVGQLVPDHQRGMAFGLVETLAGLASLIGPNVAGILYAQNADWPFVVGIAGIAGVALLSV
ncbi:MAG: MFS transporter, partial [Anaerolineae bacterium]|nr:MFS transporter [Anaerolineae bacterium]